MSLREELELDVSPALKAIDQIDSALGAATQGFQASLVDAVSVLQGIAVSLDVSSVAPEVEAAIGLVDVNGIPITVDTSQAQSEIEALDATPIDVEVDANTGPAQEQITELADTASSASGGIGDLSGVTQGFQVSAGLAGGSAAGLSDAIGGLGPEAAVAAGSLAAVAGVTATLFSDAVRAEGAVQAFNATLGNLAPQIRNLQIGDLNIDLGKLAEQLGSDDEAALTSAQRIAQLGISAGASDTQIVSVTQSIVELAANARSLNPSLGSLSEITDHLGTALARGGRFLAQYGISLTQEQIKAEAANETGKAIGTTFSQFELRAAGAKLAMDQLGPSIEKNIKGAGDNAVITLDRLKEEFRNTLEELGRPLISPVFSLIESALPIATALAGVFGTLGAALLPIAQGILAVVSPITGALTQAVQALSPAISTLGSVVTRLTSEAFGPLVGVVSAVVVLFANGLAEILVPITAALDHLPGPLLAITAGLAALGVALFLLDAHPVIAVASAVVLLAGAFHGATQEADAFVQLNNRIGSSSSAVDSGLLGNAKTLTELKTALGQTDAEFGVFIATQSEFADANIGSELRGVGESMSDLRTQLSGGEAGFRAFVTAAVAAGQVTVTSEGAITQQFRSLAEGTKLTVEQVSKLNDIQTVLFASNGKAITQGADLIGAFNKEQLAIEQASQAKINELALSGQVTQSQINEATARQQAANGTASYAQVLSDLVANVPAAAGATDVLTAALNAENQSWIDLGKNISNATSASDSVITSQNALTDSHIKLAQAQRAVADLPFQIATAQRAERSAQLDLVDAQRAGAAVQRQYVSDLLSQRSAVFALVDAQRALADVQRQPAKDANAIASANLDVESSQLAVTDATKKLADLRADPKSDPEEIQKAQIDLSRAQLEVSNSTIRVADAQEQASLQGENLAKAQLAVSQAQSQVDAANAKVLQHATDVARANLAISDANEKVRTSAEQTVVAIEGQQTAFENLAKAVAADAIVISAFADAGKNAGEAFTAGMVKGILEGEGFTPAQAASAMAASVASAAAHELKIQSPSRVAIELGQLFGQGLQVGLSNATPEVADASSALAGSITSAASAAIASAEAIVSDAFARLQAVTPAGTGAADARNLVAAGAGSSSVGGGVTIQSMTIQVVAGQGTTEEHARAVGAAAMDGAIDAASRAHARVDARRS